MNWLVGLKLVHICRVFTSNNAKYAGKNTNRSSLRVVDLAFTKEWAYKSESIHSSISLLLLLSRSLLGLLLALFDFSMFTIFALIIKSCKWRINIINVDVTIVKMLFFGNCSIVSIVSRSLANHVLETTEDLGLSQTWKMVLKIENWTKEVEKYSKCSGKCYVETSSKTCLVSVWKVARNRAQRELLRAWKIDILSLPLNLPLITFFLLYLVWPKL